MSSVATDVPGYAEARDAFVNRMLQNTLGAMSSFAMYLGDRLGYYRALADGAWCTPQELADRTGTHERYAREWLEQQVVSGVLEVEDSILHCLPVGMTTPPAAGTGTVLRADTLARYAREAGFSKVDILPIDHLLFRFYRLTP